MAFGSSQGGGARRPFFRRRKTCPFSGANAPKIEVLANNQVTVTLRWLRPGEAAADASSYVVIAQINGPG